MFKYLNPFRDEDLGDFLQQPTVMVFVIVVIVTVSFQIKYRNVLEICQYKKGLGGHTLERTCRDTVITSR